MTTTPTGPRLEPEHRARAPIRWPKANRVTVSAIAIWILGMTIALALPALIVPPGDATAPTGRIIAAFSLTVIGSMIVMVSSLGLWRRYRDPLVFVFGIVPALGCLFGGVMIAAMKYLGS